MSNSLFTVIFVYEIFSFTRAMADHTRVGPQPRVNKLVAFNQRLQGTPESMIVLHEWQLELDKTLVKINGRCLKKQGIVFGNEEKYVKRSFLKI